MLTHFCAVVLAVTSAVEPVPAVQEAMATITPQRALADVEKLCSFGTRHTQSDTASPTRGIGAARAWLRSEFAAASPRIIADLESFDVPPSERLPGGARVVNVVALLPASEPARPSRRVYVVGHLDSRNSDPLDAAGDAPGANDDASGVAVTLACARALAGAKLDNEVVFLATSGEEQGLFGAKYHAQQLPLAAGVPGEIWVLNNDIVGDPSPAFVLDDTGTSTDATRIIRVFSEGLPRNATAQTIARIRAEGAESDSPSRQLARFIADVAERERTAIRPFLIFRQDRFLRGGDHAAFNEVGFPAVRFTAPGEDYSRQHVDTTQRNGEPYGDLAAFVDGAYLANVSKLNLAVLMHLANAPALPENVRILTKELTSTTQLAWEAPAGSDAIGYEVLWRLTTQPQWTGVKDVGGATSVTLPMSKDQFFFGVRAYDADGYRTPVVFAWSAKM